MTLEVNLRPEDNKLLFLALRLCAQEVIFIKVSPEIRIFGIEVLKTISITKVTKVMVFSEMLEQVFIIKEPFFAELTKWMAYDRAKLIHNQSI